MKTKYSNLTEKRKNNILEKIRKTGMSIKDAADVCNVTTSTINKIFTERFGSRERKIMELKSQMQNQLNKLKQ
tara:strand:+ start:267 stop:485 length:219 start_codon:yes stop_codon:yes gene_type:complete